MHYFDDIKGLSAVAATYDKVLTDEDIRVIRDDFLINYGRCYMEKMATNVIIFIVPEGYAHTLRYHLKNKPLPSEMGGKEELMELMDHMTYVDDLQIVLQGR